MGNKKFKINYRNIIIKWNKKSHNKEKRTGQRNYQKVN